MNLLRNISSCFSCFRSRPILPAAQEQPTTTGTMAGTRVTQPPGLLGRLTMRRPIPMRDLFTTPLHLGSNTRSSLEESSAAPHVSVISQEEEKQDNGYGYFVDFDEHGNAKKITSP